MQLNSFASLFHISCSTVVATKFKRPLFQLLNAPQVSEHYY